VDQKLKLLLDDANHYIRPQDSAADAGDGPFDRFANKKQITDFLQNACESCITKYVYHMSRLPNICTAQAQGHILIADWSLPIDVMNINEVCCPFWCLFGCVLLLNQIFRKQCTVRQYTTLIYLINLLWKLVLVLGLDSELHYFSIFTENKKNQHLIFCECHGR